MARCRGCTEGQRGQRWSQVNRYPWFRMFTEARNDSKLDALNDREFRIWWKLLCLAAEGEDRGTVDYIDPEFVAMELRIGADELDSAISRLVRLRLVERSESKVMFPSFASRQYEKPSDLPEATRERQRKSRARHAMSRGVTRDVTPSEHIKSNQIRNTPEPRVGPTVPTRLGDIFRQMAAEAEG